MRVILIRHGETKQNVSKIIQGHQQGDLTLNGRDQARKLGARLKDEDIDVIFCSDLRRTKDTMHEIKKYHDVPLVFDKRLRERNFGSYEGRPMPKEWDWNNLASDVERGATMIKRAKEFLDDAYAHYSKKNILVVTHGGMKRAFLSMIEGHEDIESDDHGNIKNTSVTIFEMEEGKQHNILLKNCVKHLDEDDVCETER